MTPPFRHNPFSTRNVRPGAIGFVFPEGHNAKSLVEQLAAHDWYGAIVGPHGTGKSALLATLIPAIEEAGRRVIHYELHDGQRRLPPVPTMPREMPNAVIVIDGYEQLSWWSRSRLRSRCRRQGWGLLVTTHESLDLPTLFRTSVDEKLANQLVQAMLPPGDTTITPADVTTALAQHSGNLREALFALYDLYELRHAAEP